MRANEERLPSERPPRGAILVRLLAGLCEEVELLRQPVWQFAFDVDEPRVDVGSYDPMLRHLRRSFPMVVSSRTANMSKRWTARSANRDKARVREITGEAWAWTISNNGNWIAARRNCISVILFQR